MTTVSSPSQSPKPFTVPSQRHIWGAASSSSPGGGTSTFSRSLSRQSPTIAARSGARDGSASTSARNTGSTGSVISVNSNTPKAQPPQNTATSYIERGTQVDSTSDLESRSRDFGTQYTPPGLPPTAAARGASSGSTSSQMSLPLATTRHSEDRISINTKSRDSEDVSTTSNEIIEDVSMNDYQTTKDVDSGSIKRSLINTQDMAQPLPTLSRAQSNSQIKARSGHIKSNKRDSNGSASTSGSSAQSFVNSLPSPSKKTRLNPSKAIVMPKDYTAASIREIGNIIADMLQELINVNDSIPAKQGQLTRFHSRSVTRLITAVTCTNTFYRAPPSISVTEYLHRLIVHATLPAPLLLSVVYYIDQLCAKYPAFTITSLTVHRFLITAATVAAKGLSDSFWTNHTYARVGGVSTKELGMLELDFLDRLNWAIVPKPEMLENYYFSLVNRSSDHVLEDDDSSSTESSAG